MAEETVRLPGSPDVNRSWKKISTRKLSFLYSEENILPNYLRSTTSSSCHDVCKYGRKQHEAQDKPPTTVSPLKRVNRTFSGTLSFDSSLRKKKKALTESVWMNSSLGSGGTKKTVSHSFKTIGASRRRELEMVEHNKRVTALKLKSVAETAAMALRRSVTVYRKKKTNGGSESQEPKESSVVSLGATMSSKRSLETEKESNDPLVDETCEDLVEEKTLYVIKIGVTGNDTVESDDQKNQRCVMDLPNDDPKSQGEEDECVVTEDDDESNSQEEKDENTPRQGKRKSLPTESTINIKSTRLRFKRGKFSGVGVGSQNTSPRKLKFKRVKFITRADTSTKSSGRRSLKTQGSNDKEPAQQKAKSFKVALKHQETQNKRDSRVLLFNKVIKKTANKLVETRKSKVKALVGAFESVISLQERKSSSPTTA